MGLDCCASIYGRRIFLPENIIKEFNDSKHAISKNGHFILRFTKCYLLKSKQSHFFGNISRSYTVYTVWSGDLIVVVGMLMKLSLL